MQQLIHRIWYQGHQAKWLLLPLAGLFWLISYIRRVLFSCGLKQAQVLPVPVIVVGNITAGGSGKTPTVIYLIELLRQHGYKPGVISRGYGVNINGVVAVNPNAKACDVGDEPAMIVARTQVPMVVGAKRVSVAQTLLADFDVDVIISDDGLQHYALGRDIEIALVDGERRYGNHCLLPAGPLREGLWRLNSVDFVINNGGPAHNGEVLMTLEPAPLCQVDSSRHDQFNMQHNVVAMAGIGNPQRFFNSISQLGYKVVQTVEFADHQAFDQKQLSELSAQHSLLMTEKDAVKCRDFAQSNWWYLPVNAKLNSEFDHALLSQLQQVAQTKKGLSHGI
ncbi:tetraacyldisaccharide 4'-kinase [Shewanella sp. SG41-4]|uniref:tetraacyldisaccharide 4'-kinase n=1 Tax=Shewanella sp. SG41-4 TaxID=2760976 RepID=UPI0015FF979A|nr:tetraacyldisaccharide 4'-kinase [Shewanella sp. SG41-4]MBB1439536.1 tetraacyldisaccharide 4'-kinase [Shewanella sp. SG41-4]